MHDPPTAVTPQTLSRPWRTNIEPRRRDTHISVAKTQVPIGADTAFQKSPVIAAQQPSKKHDKSSHSSSTMCTRENSPRLSQPHTYRSRETPALKSQEENSMATTKTRLMVVLLFRFLRPPNLVSLWPPKATTKPWAYGGPGATYCAIGASAAYTAGTSVMYSTTSAGSST